jgi:chromosome partitioning protein
MAARKTAHRTEVPAPRSTRIITCANHKGGTGKTTTAVNVSAGLALLTQQRVLLIDCDPRGHASLALGIETKHVRYSVTDLLMGATPEVQALCWDPRAHLHILPANATLADVERDFVRRGDGRVQLQQA